MVCATRPIRPRITPNDRLRAVDSEIKMAQAEIVKWHRGNAASRRLATIPGIGPITASAIAAAVPDASLFQSGRQFAALLGLTPKAYSVRRQMI